MSNTASSPHSAHPPAARQDSPAIVSHPDPNRRRLLWLAITPGIATLVVAAATIAFLLTTSGTQSAGNLAVVLGLAGLICVGVLITTTANIVSINRARAEQIGALRAAVIADRAALPELVQQRQTGEFTGPYGPAFSAPGRLDAEAAAGGEFAVLAREVAAIRHAALEATVPHPKQAPEPQAPVQPVPEPAPMPQAESTAIAPPAVAMPPTLSASAHAAVVRDIGVFVNLARRLQSLVHREIKLLDELEAQVEDPDLLKGLFAVDHLATRMRRHAENLAILGGAVSRRQWTHPVNIHEILRSSIAEVEHYARIKLIRPIEGTLQGHVVVDVIHLVAELIENATMFSPPHTQVQVRAQHVTAGLAIEVDDRGLGMSPEERGRINAMLTAPDEVDIDELLKDGRIGLFVVASLARRHNIPIQLQSNIYGGTQAAVVLPHSILGDSGLSAAAVPPAEELPAVTAEPAPAQPNPYPTQTRTQAPQPAPEPTPMPRPVTDDTISMPAIQDPPPAPTVPQQATPAQHQQPPTPDESLYRHGEQPGPETGTGRQTVISGVVPNVEVPPGSFDGFARRTPDDDSVPLQALPPVSEQGGTQQTSQPSTGTGSNRDGRPELPKRRQQAHLAPQLRQEPEQTSDASPEQADYGLMSAFQRGGRRNEEP